MSVVLRYFGNMTEICFQVLTAVLVQILVVFGFSHRAMCFVCSETSEVRSVPFGRLCPCEVEKGRIPYQAPDIELGFRIAQYALFAPKRRRYVPFSSADSVHVRWRKEGSYIKHQI